MSRFEFLKSFSLSPVLPARGLVAKISVLAALGAVIAAPASAAVITWDSGGSSNNFSNGLNWSTNNFPNSSDDIRFGTGSRLNPFNNFGSFGTRSITFNSGAASFSLFGNEIRVNTFGGIRNNSSTVQRVNTNIRLDANQTWVQGTSAGSLDINGTVNLNGRTLTFSAGTNSVSTIGGRLSGLGSLTKVGGGTLRLRNTSNSYSGTNTLNQGVLEIRFDQDLGNTGNAIIFNGGTLRNTSSMGTSRFTAINSGGGTFDTSADLTHNGVITGTGKLTKTGAAKLILQGNKTYAGGTKIQGGSIEITADGDLGNSNTALEISNGATLRTRGTFATSNRTTTLSGGGGRFNTILGTDVFTHTGNIQQNGTASLTKTGAGTMILAGHGSYTGQTNIEGGTLRIGTFNRISDSSAVNLAADGIFDLNGNFERVGGLAGSGVTEVKLGNTVVANAGLAVNQSGNSTFSGVISGTGAGARLFKEGSGILTLSGNNTYEGATVVSGGTLRIGNSSRINDVSALSVTGTGIFDLNNRFEQVGGLSGNGTVALGAAGDLAVNQAGDSLFTGVFTGGNSGNLFKRGSGKLTLSGLSTHTGATFIEGGTLEVSQDRNLGSTTGTPGGLFLRIDATLRTTGTFTTDRFASLGAGGGTFDTAGGTALTINGVVYGSGALNKEGDGTLVLGSGANTYSGDTNIDKGTLRLGASNGVGDSSDVNIGVNSTFDGAGFSDTVATVTNDGNLSFVGGALIVSGKLTNNATATVSNLTAGSVENGFGAQLNAAGNIGGALDNNGTLDVTGTATIGGTITNLGDINIAGGRFLRPDGGMDNFGSVNLTGGGVAGSGTVTNFATIQGKGAVTAGLNNFGQVLANGGGVLSVTNLAGGQNDGEMRVETGSTLNVGAVKNAGLVVGAGNVIGAVENNATIRAEGGTLRMTSAGNANTAAGVIEAGTGNTVQYTAGLNTNDGLVALTGGAFDNNANALTNSATGRIEGRGTIRTGGTGLTNDGQVSFVNGNADVFGNVQNNGGGRLDINDAAVTFFNAVTNDGTLESNRSNVSFLGGFVNNGTLITDPNTLNFTDWTNNDPAATIADAGDIFNVSNDLLGDTANNVVWDTDQAILRIVAGNDNAHTMELYGIDLGADVSGLSENFAWGELEIANDQTLSLADAKADGTDGALYLNIIDLAGGIADIVNGEVQSIFGNGFNIYYNSLNGDNDYLGGLTYDLQGGGQLIALNVEVAGVPAPGMILIFGIGLAGLGFVRRKRTA